MEGPARFSGLRRRRVGDLVLPVATGRARLLGLSLLDRDQAGPGLIIPRCHSIHTHGMRFPLHVAFMKKNGEIRRLTLGLEPGQFLSTPGADLVVEIVPGGPDDLEAVRAMFAGARGAGRGQA